MAALRGRRSVLESVTVDFLLVANHVEVVNGLLYVSGGGWTEHRRPLTPQGPALSHLGIGVSVLVPWTATNQPHTLTIQVEDEDATPVLKIDGQFNVGRPPTLPAGAEQPVLLGFPLNVQFPHAGTYRAIATVDEDGASKHWTFRVYDVPMQGPAPGQATL
jgi:hypothetical protein